MKRWNLQILWTLSFLLGSCSLWVEKDLRIIQLWKEEKSIHPFPMIQGLTTSTSTEIRVISKKSDQIQFRILDDENQRVKNIRYTQIFAGSTGYIIHQLQVQGLEFTNGYLIQVLEDKKEKPSEESSELKILDQRRFNLVDLNKKAAKLGVVSCLKDQLKAKQHEMWTEYLNHQPDYTFMIGDNVYADQFLFKEKGQYKFKYADEDALWRRYIETFQTLTYYRSARLTPTLAIWDDHDYGINNGGKSYPFKKESLKVFQSFFGFSSISQVTEDFPGAGYIFNAFGQRFVFVDARSFRTEVYSKNSKGGDHWGKKQMKAILRSMNMQPQPTWLIQGDQYFGGYHPFESFERLHPQRFKVLLDQLKKSKSRVFFVSGDRHLTELMKIEPQVLGYSTYEMTSSAIHASVFLGAWEKHPNPRQISGVSGIENYSIIQTHVKGARWDLDIIAYGPKMKELYDHKVQISR